MPHPPAAFGAAGDIADKTCVPAFEHYSPRWSVHGIGADTAGVHRSEVAPSLADKLIDLRLAVPARGEWLAMNPELAWLYKCRLTEELARRNNLVPTTDQMPAHAVMDGPVDVGSALGQAGRSSPPTSRRDSGSSASMPSSLRTWIGYRQPRSLRSGAGSPRSSTGGASTPMRRPQRWRLSCKPSSRLRSCRRTWTML